jgi:ferric-dicitrate binding protein FerR (iron transport regulator)
MDRQNYILLLHKKMTGEITRNEAEVLEKWRRADLANDSYLRDLEAIWLSSKNYSPSPQSDLQKAKGEFFTKIQKPSTPGQVHALSRDTQSKNTVLRFQWVAGIAASLLILIASLFVYRYYTADRLPEFMQIAEPYVQIAEESADNLVELKDGTQLWLKPGSYFTYEKAFNQKDRIVYLSGEMFIHVAPDLEKPFIINTELNQVKVLGTSFYLKADETEVVKLRVEEGVVQISDTTRKKKLVKAGDEVVYDKKKQEFAQSEYAVADQWRQNYLVFENAPLTSVFDKLKVFYGVNFTVDCKGVEQMDGFTSLLQQDAEPKLEVILKTLEKVYGIQIDEIQPKSYRVYGGPCK